MPLVFTLDFTVILNSGIVVIGIINKFKGIKEGGRVLTSLHLPGLVLENRGVTNIVSSPCPP